MFSKFINFSRIVFVGVLATLPILGFSQAESNKVVSDTTDKVNHSFVKLEKITKFYTKSELEKMPKLDLLEIYKSRLTYLIEVLPFISLHPEPGSTFRDMSIPETEANIAHLDKETKNKQAFVKSLNETLDDVIPYSEKVHMIWAIMYFDEMIKKSDYTKSK